MGRRGLNLLGQAVVAEEVLAVPDGRLHPGLPRLRLGSAERDLPRPQGPDREIRRADDRERATRPSSPSPSRAAAPIPAARSRRAPRRRATATSSTAPRSGSPASASPNWGLVFARTGRARAAAASPRSSSRRSPRASRYKPIPVIRSYFPYEISFEDCEVPEENRLGEEGEGFKLAENWLVHARIPYAAAVIGVAQAALAARHRLGEAARDLRLQARRQAGDPVDDRRLARSSCAPRGCSSTRPPGRATSGRTSRSTPRSARSTRPRSPARWSTAASRSSAGSASRSEMPLERWYREMRIKRIGEGPSEVHRMVVARDLLGGQRKKA